MFKFTTPPENGKTVLTVNMANRTYRFRRSHCFIHNNRKTVLGGGIISRGYTSPF